ncbi:MAG TPA: lipopolysaccharide assembly protein LapA domain-containing protein [Acetobacteraceae bacterium]|nr:lipopolysaccharide assembly protein LapA domain-containing protein [Acetobacteraceae bacterium]
MRLVIASPFLLLLVLFALSNTAPVSLGLWPTDLAVRLPLSLAVLAGMAIAFLAGALLVWTETLRQRARARRAEARARLLEARLPANPPA